MRSRQVRLETQRISIALIIHSLDPTDQMLENTQFSAAQSINGSFAECIWQHSISYNQAEYAISSVGLYVQIFFFFHTHLLENMVLY